MKWKNGKWAKWRTEVIFHFSTERPLAKRSDFTLIGFGTSDERVTQTFGNKSLLKQNRRSNLHELSERQVSDNIKSINQNSSKFLRKFQ